MKKKLLFPLVVIVIFIYFFSSSLKNKEYFFNPATFDVVSDESKSPHLTPDIKQILTQNFTYLGEGGQAYAFCSSDGKHVLKIFKKKHIKPEWYIVFIPNISWFKQVRDKHQRNLLSNVIKTYVDAFELDSQGCGILYTHFNPEEKIDRVIEVQDKLGNSHLLDLDNIPFLIQEKAIPFCQVLKQHLDEGETELANQRIDQMLDLYDKHMDQGLYDLGIGVLHNNGFVGQKPIHLDVGHYVFAPDSEIDKDQKMEEIKGRIQAFVSKNSDLN